MDKPELTGSVSDIAFLLYFFKGANSRRKILESVAYGCKSCNQIAVELGLNWRTTYRHLQILENEHLVKSFGFGQRRFYKLMSKGELAIKNFAKSNTTVNTTMNG